MGLFDRLFSKPASKNPEDKFIVTINERFVRVEHPKKDAEVIEWNDIKEIKLINTDEGPIFPDVWLVLIGTASSCFIPLGAKGYDEVYEIVSRYNGFNFENVIKSMQCTDNAEFELWKKDNPI